MKTIELANIIKSRRSVRAYQNKPVPEELLLEAVELAAYAPNAGNQQNWHFYIVLKKEVINALADAIKSNADMMSSWPEAGQFGDKITTIADKMGFVRSAPAVIAVATGQYESPVIQLLELRAKKDPAARQIQEWRAIANSKIQSVASAVTELLLVLHQMGLGAVWMTGPMEAKGQIEKILKVPAKLDIVALIPVGYPAENPPLKERKPIQEICEVIK